MAWTTLCEWDELIDGQGLYIEIEGFQLAVFRNGETVAVMDNHCPHAGANLSGGTVHDGCAICPRHNWAFRLDTGELNGMPGAARVRVYPVRRVPRADHPTLIQADLPMY